MIVDEEDSPARRPGHCGFGSHTRQPGAGSPRPGKKFLQKKNSDDAGQGMKNLCRDFPAGAIYSCHTRRDSACRASPYSWLRISRTDAAARFLYARAVPPSAAFSVQEDVANFLPQISPGAPTRFFARESVCQRPNASALISATILTKDSESLLAAVLAALDWCDEVVVLDTGSRDGTVAIAKSFANVSVHQLARPFPGFGRAHRRAVELARNDWILSVDSDEIVSPTLAAEIMALPLDPRTVYTIPFQNYYNGKHITTCGWSPDRHERLFNRTVTNFCTSEIHERVQTKELDIVDLAQPIAHYSYRSVDDFLRKMSAYSRLFATQRRGKRRGGAFPAVAHSVWAFFKSYVLERGILQGAEGLTISAYKSQVVFWKYLMLHEANRRASA